MTDDNFISWLAGFLEMREGPLSKEETKCIKDHLALIITKVTPSYDSLEDMMKSYKEAADKAANEIKAHPSHVRLKPMGVYNPNKRIC